MSRRVPILDDLGRELVRAAREDAAHRSAEGWVGRVRRAIVIGVLALLGLAAVAAAASLILGRGDPIPAPPVRLVPIELQPVPGTQRRNGLDVRDPDGGPPWDVRTSRSETGAICATVGQVLDGELGLLGLDRRFRALPAGAADTCSREQRSGATLVGARAFSGARRLGDLTVVSGVAAAGVRSAVAVAGGRTTRMRLGRAQAFLAIFRGLPEELRPRVVLTEASGKRTTLRFADSGEFVAGDPGGGPPWTLRYSIRRDGLRCIRPGRGPGPQSGVLVRAPWRCGRREQPFVAIRRFVPQRLSLTGPFPRGRGRPPRQPEFEWVGHPARTLVWGSTARAGGEVVVTGAGPPRRVRAERGVQRTLPDGVSRAPRGRGGFAVVLHGRVDPRRLRVSVDGRPLDPARTLDPNARRVGREPVPAWRSIASLAGHPSSRDPIAIVPGSASISRRAPHPAGGPAWALRSWSVRTGAGWPGPDRYRPRLCFAIGVEQRRRLVEPLPGGGTRTVGTGEDDRRCPPSGEPAADGAGVELRTYVNDADSPDPWPVAVVVAGLLGDAARSAELLGAGPPRTLALGRHGTFLIVLGPEHAGRPLRLRVRGADGVARTGRTLHRMPPAWRCVPTRGQSLRVADPGGGPSWMTGRGRSDGHSCRYTGRAIGNRIATLVDGRNWVRFEAGETSVLYTRRPRAARRPLALRITDRIAAMSELPWRSRSAAQVARRTLPGRTVLTGSATDAVEAVTLRTPRDIRTVRPGPAGLLLAVYDGVFYGGDVHATAHMRDGRTITQTFPLGGPG